MAKVVYQGGGDDAGRIGENAVARKRDMVIYQGDDFAVNVGFGSSPTNRLNMTGWEVYCSFKKTTDGIDSVDAITTVREDGLSVRIALPAEMTANMSGTYVYDLELINLEGRRKTYMYGSVEVIPEVTKAV